MSYDYIKRYYGLVFKVGQRVQHAVTRKHGSVRRMSPSQGHYVMVQFDGERHRKPCHPEELRVQELARAALEGRNVRPVPARCH